MGETEERFGGREREKRECQDGSQQRERIENATTAVSHVHELRAVFPAIKPIKEAPICEEKRCNIKRRGRSAEGRGTHTIVIW